MKEELGEAGRGEGSMSVHFCKQAAAHSVLCGVIESFPYSMQ